MSSRHHLMLTAEPLVFYLKKSVIHHEQAGKGMLAGRPMSSREMIGYHYELLVYSGLCAQKQLRNAYGADVMAVTVEQFMK